MDAVGTNIVVSTRAGDLLRIVPRLNEDVNEESRLRYRYIDLRRPEMQQRLQRRVQVVQAFRTFLDRNGFGKQRRRRGTGKGSREVGK